MSRLELPKKWETYRSFLEDQELTLAKLDGVIQAGSTGWQDAKQFSIKFQTFLSSRVDPDALEQSDGKQLPPLKRDEKSFQLFLSSIRDPESFKKRAPVTRYRAGGPASRTARAKRRSKHSDDRPEDSPSQDSNMSKSPSIDVQVPDKSRSNQPSHASPSLKLAGRSGSMSSHSSDSLTPLTDHSDDDRATPVVDSKQKFLDSVERATQQSQNHIARSANGDHHCRNAFELGPPAFDDRMLQPAFMLETQCDGGNFEQPVSHRPSHIEHVPPRSHREPALLGPSPQVDHKFNQSVTQSINHKRTYPEIEQMLQDSYELDRFSDKFKQAAEFAQAQEREIKSWTMHIDKQKQTIGSQDKTILQLVQQIKSQNTQISSLMAQLDSTRQLWTTEILSHSGHML